MTPIITIAFAIAAYLLVSCAADSSGSAVQPQGGNEAELDAGVGAWDPFFVLIAFTRVEPVPITPREQVLQSSAIVEGYFDDVQDGRVGDYIEGASNPMQTAVFKVRVARVITGDIGNYVYVEFHRGGIPIARMQELLPRDTPMIFILRRASETWDPRQIVFTNEGSGIPSGEILYSFMYPAGVAVKGEVAIDYPLAEDPFNPIFRSSNLVDLRGELTALLQGATN